MAGNIVLITPGSGYQQVSAEELNSTLDAVASGADLNQSQQTIANALQSAAPRQGNVFSGGQQSESSVKDPATAKETPVAPLPGTVAAQDPKTDFRSFLSGLTPSQTGQPLGSPLPGVPLSTAGSVGDINIEGLKALLFPPATTSGVNQGRGGGSTLGDADLAADVENLRLGVEKSDLEQLRQNQILSEQVRRGIVPAAARVTNRLGNPIVDLSKIGLTQSQVDATRPRITKDQLLPMRRSIIGAPRLPSIIAR